MRRCSGLLLLLLGGTTPVGAQESSADSVPPNGSACDGRLISRVEIFRSARTVIDRQKAPAWSRPFLQPLLLGEPTRASAVRPYMLLQSGDVCTEFRRAESERVLRLQPFLADATVRAVFEPDGRARIEVETIDDIRPIVGIAFDGVTPDQVELGNSNVAGGGYLVSGGWQNGGAYRTGYGGRTVAYHLFGTPTVAQLTYRQEPRGKLTRAIISHPLFSDLQRTALYAGYDRNEGFQSFMRPDDDDLSIETTSERADVGFVYRFSAIGRTTYLVGARGNYERRAYGDATVIITDSGFIASSDETLVNRFEERHGSRLGLVMGVRALTFAKVIGFDGLEGVQDVGRGLQVAATVGKGISGTDRRRFSTLDLYTGVGSVNSFLGLRVQLEGRQNDGKWGNGVGSGRMAWYSHPRERQTRIVSVEYVGSSSDSIPYQLTMGDVESGLRGYSGSRLSGGRRLIGRTERRFILPGISRYFGWGVAGFADVGKIWAASAPFGSDGMRASTGISILAAVPRESRSVARIDIGYPLLRDDHARGVDVRIAFRVAGRSFWREPVQIARARLGTPTTEVFSWP